MAVLRFPHKFKTVLSPTYGAGIYCEYCGLGYYLTPAAEANTRQAYAAEGCPCAPPDKNTKIAHGPNEAKLLRYWKLPPIPQEVDIYWNIAKQAYEEKPA